MKYKISSATFLFIAVLLTSFFAQISNSRSRAESLKNLPNAELELEAADQVQELNEHSLKNFEIPTGSENE